MASWFENNRRLFREEKEALAAACSLMRLAVVESGFLINTVCWLIRKCALAHGTYILQAPDVEHKIGYRIALLVADDHPQVAPLMFSNDPKLPIGDSDRHIMRDGRACLGVQAEIGQGWPPGSNFVTFLQKLVAPFLAWQAYYDFYSCAPPWGERSHTEKGIMEFYAELLGDFADPALLSFMGLLARKNKPKGHELCPCGSGKKLHDCHKGLVSIARTRAAWQDVETDLRAYKQTTAQAA